MPMRASKAFFGKRKHPDIQTSRHPDIQLAAPEEIALAKHLLNFGLTLEAVAEEYRPNFLCNYLFELAGKFTSFYENCPVLKAEDAATRDSRLALCDLTARVLKQGLETFSASKPSSRCKYPGAAVIPAAAGRVDSRHKCYRRREPLGLRCLTIEVTEDSEEVFEFALNAFLQGEGIQARVFGPQPGLGGLSNVRAVQQPLIRGLRRLSHRSAWSCRLASPA